LEKKVITTKLLIKNQPYNQIINHLIFAVKKKLNSPTEPASDVKD